MGNTLYLECNSGISGDMTVAALLDLGADWEKLKGILESLSVEGFQIRKSVVKKAGIACVDFQVLLDHGHENHDHDMEYLHGHDHPHDHHHPHEHGHAHKHRGIQEIYHIIEESQMSERAKELAKGIFRIIAEAEAKAHNLPVDQVHFHEVGAVDSIVDIVAVAVCLDDLHIEEVIVPKICEGTGTVRCQHGILPIPVPAVVNIVESHHLPICVTAVKGELVTPTGAAIVAAIKTKETLPQEFLIQRVGLGAGKRQYDCPGFLRAMLIKDKSGPEESIYKLETTIDDSTGEEMGFVMEKLFMSGARDVYYTPVYMKKNRPAYELSVICMEKDISLLEQLIFCHTTTIGVRRTKWERTVLPREIITLCTKWGEAMVKKCKLGEQFRYYPEYESVKEISLKTGLSYREIYQEIQAQIENEIGGNEKCTCPTHC